MIQLTIYIYIYICLCVCVVIGHILNILIDDVYIYIYIFMVDHYIWRANYLDDCFSALYRVGLKTSSF